MSSTARARRPHAVSSLSAAGSVLVALAVLLVQTPAAWAFPKGAYWYTTYGVTKVWKITRGNGVTVAVVDGGVKATTGDLRGRVVTGVDLTGTNPGATNERPESRNFGHGTAMAALIAGTGQGGGLYGMAPAAKILPVDIGKVADSDAVATGINAAVAHKVGVINLSIGGEEACTGKLRTAVANAVDHDIIVVASAGDSPGSVNSPANCPGAIAIGGVDSAFKPWTQTPSGLEVDFVAPAFNLVNEELDGTLSGPYPENSGTSQAAAITSGIFALLRAHYPTANVQRILQIATNNVHNNLGAGNQGKRIDNTLGYGEILPYFALTNSTPMNAPNPVYDEIRKQLGTTTSHAPPSDSSSPSNSSAPPPNPSSRSSSITSTSASSDSSGSGTVRLIVGIVVVALLVGSVILFVSRRNRRSGPPPFGR